MAINLKAFEENKQLRWRHSCRETFLALSEIDDKVDFVLADLGRVYNWEKVKEKYPDRVYNCGIAEQNAISACAGMATMGRKPFFATFAPFATLRVLEQIRDDCAYAELPVRIIGSDTGVAMPELGTTHYGIEDMAAALTLPNLLVLSPSDPIALAKLSEKLLDDPRPAYIRIHGGQVCNHIYSADQEFEIGKAITVREGKDAAIIACGNMVYNSLKAAEKLEEQGISVKVVDMSTVAPIDAEAVKAAAETGLVFTVEEHSIRGGLGSMVAEVMAEGGKGRLVRLGMPHKYISVVSSYDKMIGEMGLDAEGIANSITKELKK